MIIDNITLLIPSHPPHYHYIYNLLNKLKSNDITIDVYIVFSNMKDYTLFLMKDFINYIILTPFTTSHIVTYKKFMGLTWLGNHYNYEYIICCDSEIDIIPNNFTSEIINEKINQIFNNKKIYAGNVESKFLSNIVKECASIFKDHFEMIKDVTDNFSLYYWWSDLPVYRSKDLIPFLNMINYNNITNFDYMIYQNYLIIYHGFEITPTTHITNQNHSLENLITNDENVLQELLNIGYGFSWNNNMVYTLNKNFINNQKGFIIFNLDRYNISPTNEGLLYLI